jgi:hypothetical protein
MLETCRPRLTRSVPSLVPSGLDMTEPEPDASRSAATGWRNGLDPLSL